MSVDAPDYLEPYLRAVDSCGPGFPALLFSSRELQQRRFAVFAASIALTGRCIADLGSGHADLLAWLDEQAVAYARYVAVEAIAAFDLLARRDHPRARFLCRDFVAEPKIFEELVRDHGADTLLFSGSLNTLDDERALEVLERAWAVLGSGGVLAFNFLAGGGAWERPVTGLPRRDCGQWIAWALERTPQILFCAQYLGNHDATLVMHRT